MSSRNLFQNSAWFHRLVGARGSTTAGSLPTAASTSTTTSVEQQQQKQQKDLTSLLPPALQNRSDAIHNYGHFYEANLAASEIAKHRLVFFGEIHSRPPIISFQRAVQDEMAKVVPSTDINNNNDKLDQKSPSPPGVLHVVMEHFSFDMQPLLDAYQEGKISFDELKQKYNDIGTENHDLEPYRKLLEDAKRLHNHNDGDDTSHRKTYLHAGFLSRNFARMLMKEGEEETLKQAGPWLPWNASKLLEGTDTHYNIFESLLTGRPPFDRNQAIDDRFQKIFKAQLLKDVAAAHKINTMLEASGNHDPTSSVSSKQQRSAESRDKILVLAGNGHVLGYSGIPDFVLRQYPDMASETCVVVSRHAADLEVTSDETELKRRILDDLAAAMGPPGTNIADYVYIYKEEEQTDDNQQPQNADDATAAAAVKEETKRAYDKVGESAHVQGNTAKAIAIMKAMNYSEDHIAIAGADVHNFQGVGNPHLHARAQPGETVLDVGSGLGIDSFIAYHAATTGSAVVVEDKVGTTATENHNTNDDSGFVIGIDISTNEVRHAQSCAQRRGLDKMRFAVADMEKIPLPDESVDVVISNGAFCLAPDKHKAFAEVFRVLKPGGRISICTTTTQDESKLEPGVSWPVCMKMFIPKNEIQPICEQIGYVDVFVDDSDSSMSIELPVEVLEMPEVENPNNPKGKRNKVHVGSAEFSHLEDYDMDALCARVCVVARKPASNPKKAQTKINTANTKDKTALVWEVGNGKAANCKHTSDDKKQCESDSYHVKIYLKDPAEDNEGDNDEDRTAASDSTKQEEIEASVLQYQRQLRKTQASKRAGAILTKGQLDIVYQDSDIAVVNKPAGVLCVPGINNNQSVANLLFDAGADINEDQRETSRDGDDRCPDACSMAVHRLDMDTSGLVVYGKTKAAVSTLHKVFRRESENDQRVSKKRRKQKPKIEQQPGSEAVVTKEYEALVCGHFPLHIQSGTIDLPLQRDVDHPPFMRVSTPYSEALARQVVDELRQRNWTKLSKRNPKPSQTEFQVVSREYYYPDEKDSDECPPEDRRRFPVTRLSLTPITGRTHQLRVHCAAMGFPILGDPVYGIYGESAYCGGLYHNPVEIIADPTDKAWAQPKGDVVDWRAPIALQKQLMTVYPPGERPMCLHAKRLGVPHPRTRDVMQWQAPPKF